MKYLKQKGVDIVLVGEAPGYLGCKLTGIPFTDEEQLKNPENQFALGNWINNKMIGNTSEKTASCVWKTLRQRKNIVPLLWNIFPFHPHKEGNGKSNRGPTSSEMIIGKFLLNCLLIMFNISDDQIYAVGRKAQEQLKLSEQKYIRHPSFGGNFEFEKKYLSILNEL